MHIIISGGSGLIGRRLVLELLRGNHEISILSRNPVRVDPFPAGVQVVAWDGKTAEGWGHLVDGTAVLVNLAGENIAGEGFFPTRWTEERKHLIRQSRLDAGSAISQAIALAVEKPKALVQSSAIGYYGPLGDQPVDEASAPGFDFMARLCQEWEQSTETVEALGVRRLIIRTGVVISEHGGALGRLILPYKLFVGGPFGTGRQVISWIHVDDVAKAIHYLIEHPEMQGTYNLTAPNPVTNSGMGRAIAKTLHRPYYLPLPGFVLRFMFGEVAAVVLEGQRVLPTRLLNSGYVFKYPRIESALADIL